MMAEDLGSRFARWALREGRVLGVVRIGSQVRGRGGAAGADVFSDFDFQIVTTDMDAFENPDLFVEAGIGTPIAHVVRMGRLGSARKLTSLFSDGELDVVLIPAAQFEGLRQQGTSGEALADPRVRAALQDLAAVIVGGFEILKGAEFLAPLYEYVRTSVPVPRLSNKAACECAEAFVCDYVSVLRKVGRGEMIAAQRWLHHQLAETNLRLLHELRQRQQAPSFPDGRRVESLVGEPWSARVKIEANLERASLETAAERAAEVLRLLMRELVGDAWTWPDLPLATPAR